jgi:ATP-binding cassette subfamily B protein
VKVVLKYLKPFALAILLAIALLFGQAMGELTMPNLMSDIVNVGVQGGGITESFPKELTQKGMILLTSFMTPEDKTAFENAYTRGGETEHWKALDFNQDASLRLGEIYGRAVYVFFTKAMDMMKNAPQAQQMNAQGDLTEIEPEQMYQLGAAVYMANQATLQSDLEQLQGADSALYQQFGTAMTKLLYRDAGLNTAKLQRHYIYQIGIQMVLLALGCGLCAVCVSLLSARISAGFSRNLRRAVFKKVQSFTNAEIDKFSTASLITRSTNDVQQVQMLILMGIRMMVFAPVMGIGGLIMALRKSPGLSWIIALAVAVLICTLVVVMLVVLPKFKALQGLIDRLNLVSRENLTGLMVVRAFGNEKHEEERFRQAAHNLAKTERFVFRSMATLMPLMMVLINGISMLVVWFGGKAIEASKLQIGDMMAFIQYAMNIIFSFMFIAMAFVMVPRASVSANRIKEVLETESTILDPQQALPYPAGKAKVTFDHVSFRYGGAEEDVLEDISFTAEPGQTTAFIGATGAGKTTLVNLLERFYDVTAGAIYINGVDIRKMEQAQLRKHIGFVPQRTVLFSGNILSNIKYDNDAMDEKTVRRALQAAQAEDFIAEQEDGLEAHVAQGGSNFSGGQKQRLSIARAFARKPEIFVFDDSFSALDYKTDAALRKALRDYTADATVLLIAQRVSTILHADRIVVLDEGKIAGIGTHGELLRSCEVYREIAESQLSKEELA